ncbi:hypothetical protein [Burkholderia sp. PAMC 26561]|uniref:hypothetical protein n=1 Tax=Burkholderia sp. PAMC 26561 TaxID=1795043 RepID=UPI00076AE823|nr:hypothetical protein [Burkholderia sp. PAMC 26561]AME24215.1 hypothetical protein AXG89_10495 [Burkholderia sp. PAMC 26561]
MARPKIGLFGALIAVGSVLAWKWAQTKRDTVKRTPRDLTRWEDEGGKVVTPSTATASGQPVAARPANGSNGALGGTPDAWHFPHS